MTLYERFRALQLDYGAIGLEDRGSEGGYFCTPVGARVIGWPGVDGIHFCFVRGHREMVFAVSPMNGPGAYIHPVAKTFRDFLRLLLSCGVDALEQLWAWDRETFEAFAAENQPDAAARAVLDILAEAFSLKPMQDPFGYVKALQAAFDPNSLTYGEAYYDVLWENLPWQVYFSGAPTGAAEDGERPGREIPVNRSFDWEGQAWELLSLYVCDNGLVGDFCIEVNPGAEETFLEKWTPILETGLTGDQEEQLQLENPFVLDVDIRASINGQDCRNCYGSQIMWNSRPLTEESRDRDAKRWLEHYGCSPDMSWIFLRTHWQHRWEGAPLAALALTFTEQEARIPGPRFVGQSGERVEFQRPATGQRHILTVEALSSEEITPRLPREGWEIPTHFCTLTYRVEPPLPQGVLQVQDCARGDSPRQTGMEPEGVSCVGMIGGADGPTALVFSRPGGLPLQAACSSLYFDQPETIAWRMIFREPRRIEKQVKIL